MIEKVAFTAYPIQDPDRARAFYEGVLGLDVGMHGGQNGMVWIEYDLPGGGCIALTNTTGDAPGGGGTIALEVTDLDALIAHLKAHDVELLATGIKGPRCRMAVCRDPEGNKLLLHQLDEMA